MLCSICLQSIMIQENIYLINFVYALSPTIAKDENNRVNIYYKLTAS